MTANPKECSSRPSALALLMRTSHSTKNVQPPKTGFYSKDNICHKNRRSVTYSIEYAIFSKTAEVHGISRNIFSRNVCSLQQSRRPALPGERTRQGLAARPPSPALGSRAAPAPRAAVTAGHLPPPPAAETAACKCLSPKHPQPHGAVRTDARERTERMTAACAAILDTEAVFKDTFTVTRKTHLWT